jgi:hypothetical protein
MALETKGEINKLESAYTHVHEHIIILDQPFLFLHDGLLVRRRGNQPLCFHFVKILFCFHFVKIQPRRRRLVCAAWFCVAALRDFKKSLTHRELSTNNNGLHSVTLS